MTEKEYIEFLEALAAEYVGLNRSKMLLRKSGYFRESMDELLSLARFVKVAEERANTKNVVLKALGSELRTVSWHTVSNILEDTGINEALDAYSDTLLANFRVSVVPKEDLDILRLAGIGNPEAVMRIVEVQARNLSKLAATNDFQLSSAVASAGGELHKVGKKLEATASNEEKKPRKWFKGLGRVLAGGAGVLGNVLLGVGAIPAATPVGAAAVLGSCTGAIVLIGDGLEAIRGTD